MTTPAWVRLRLDLETFDERQFAPYVDRCSAAGLDLTTLAELGDSETHRRRLYELNRTCSADIPARGGFYTYDAYVAERIDVATFDPRGVVVASESDSWVGFASTSIHEPSATHREGYAFSEMTGVLRTHRGRGLSLALKVRSVEFARRAGVPVLRTFHHPANVSAIAMNRRLGFVDEAPA